MMMYSTLWEKSRTLKSPPPPWLKALADAKVPWDVLTPMATICWLQRLSNCIELHSKSPFSARMHFFFFSHDVWFSRAYFSISVCAIMLSLRIHQRGIKASRNVCFRAYLLDWSQPFKHVRCSGCNLLVPTKVRSGALHFVQFGLENLAQANSKMSLQELSGDPYVYVFLHRQDMLGSWRQVHNIYLTVTTVRLISNPHPSLHQCCPCAALNTPSTCIMAFLSFCWHSFP